jgi:hypothetical protein
MVRCMEQRLSANQAGAEITRLDMTMVRVSRMGFWNQEMSAIEVWPLSIAEAVLDCVRTKCPTQRRVVSTRMMYEPLRSVAPCMYI